MDRWIDRYKKLHRVLARGGRVGGQAADERRVDLAGRVEAD